MPSRFPALAPLLGLLAVLSVLMASASPVYAAPASLTYTGQLLSSTSPPAAVANGLYDMKFQLYTAATGGLPFGSPVSLPSVPVVSGLYYVQLYFGTLFTGTTYWIQVSYRPAGSAAAYTLVSPRPIAPDSAYANYAALSGSTLALQGRGVSTAVPATGQVLTYNGTLWTPGAVGAANLALPLALAASSADALLSVTNSGSGDGIYGQSDSDVGIYGSSSSYVGVLGQSSTYLGIEGYSGSSTGVYGYSAAADSSGTLGDFNGYGVYGHSPGSAAAVYGSNTGSSLNGGYGVYGHSANNYGGYFLSDTYDGMSAVTNNGNGNGIRGQANNGTSAYGVYGTSSQGIGVYGIGGAYAGYFNGNVSVTGSITAGTKDFKIDHPLDPAHRYLYHASVESDEMEDVYSGNVTLGRDGAAAVTLPDWFQSLNADFRYQVTCIGGFAPVYVASEIANNRFGIAGGRPGMKVSWQVTGVRHDAFALAHPLQVEQDKPDEEQGRFQNPDAFGLTEDRGIGYAQRQAHERPAPSARP